MSSTEEKHKSFELFDIISPENYPTKNIKTESCQISVSNDEIKVQINLKGVLRRTASGRTYLLKEIELSWTPQYGSVVKFTHYLLSDRHKTSHIIRTRYHSNCAKGWFLAKNVKGVNFRQDCHLLHEDMILTYIRYTLVPESEQTSVIDCSDMVIDSGSLNDLESSISVVENILSSTKGARELAAKYMWEGDTSKCIVCTCVTINTDGVVRHDTNDSEELTKLFLAFEEPSSMCIKWSEYEPIISKELIGVVIPII
ncbi:hypothetical protein YASMINEVIRUS_9 [Yasminevirus sp. GU-2018]|uniref:Uncharacterized protein n=1 Tax=Yasminevirus sp. GU-2018 TaxID=2420051 RepID=A0A5K0U753_9VIRU|nr:hypothetical protein YASMINEVIRUS_9 [Yasminevirus sp. GU-2018]